MEDDISPANAAMWEALNDAFIEPPEFAGIQKAIAEQLNTVAVRKNDSSRWGVGNRAKVNGIIVTGSYRVGKTDLVEEALGTLEPVTTVCGQAVGPKVVSAECPPTFSSAALGRHIMRLLNYRSERQFSADWAWDRVDMRLPKEQPTVLFIDEYQRTFHPTNVGKKRLEDVRLEIQSVFRHLLDLPAWPTPLVLVGLPEIIGLLEDPKYKFLRDRMETFSVASMRMDEPERVRLRSALTSFLPDGKALDGTARQRLLQPAHPRLRSRSWPSNRPVQAGGDRCVGSR